MSVYRQGDKGPAVAEIRARLRAVGFLAPDGNGDVFDDECDRAVRTFQQRRGLTVDGAVGTQTYRALDEARWSLGDRLLHYQVAHPFVGDDVVALQARLLELGFDSGRCDGVFGPVTAGALREFQRNVGLPDDGLFGPTTIREMERLRRSVVGGAPAALREHEALHRSGRTLAGKSVIVDPGHGAGAAGHRVGDLTEAAVAYDIASRLEGRIGAAGGYAYLTRSSEGNPPDEERANFANAAEADLFVSLHVDGAPSPRCEGVATYFFGAGPSRTSVVGAHLAELVQREIVARTDLLDARTHAKNWDLLRLTRMPAVRVEVGYLTNDHDRARLAEPSFRDTVAEAIFAGLQRLYLAPDDDPGTGQLRLPALAH